jgi:hypothetical protein
MLSCASEESKKQTGQLESGNAIGFTDLRPWFFQFGFENGFENGFTRISRICTNG